MTILTSWSLGNFCDRWCQSGTLTSIDRSVQVSTKLFESAPHRVDCAWTRQEGNEAILAGLLMDLRCLDRKSAFGGEGNVQPADGLSQFVRLRSCPDLASAPICLSEQEQRLFCMMVQRRQPAMLEIGRGSWNTRCRILFLIYIAVYVASLIVYSSQFGKVYRDRLSS